MEGVSIDVQQGHTRYKIQDSRRFYSSISEIRLNIQLGGVKAMTFLQPWRSQP